MPGNTFHTSKLDEFVAECDRRGGIQHPDCVGFIHNFHLEFETNVEVTIDPFSDEYFKSQVALYEEIAGRKLDQDSGEQFDVPANFESPNPYASGDIRFIAKHARTILNCVMLADLKPGSKVLDLGCGWGLSSEMIGFTGAHVHAVDINPQFTDLVTKRLTRRGIPHDVTVSSFDQFDTGETYELILFYECLHHSAKVWETVEHMAKFLKPGGKMIFAGEPINNSWWPEWGMRLDPLSVFCIRKFGWFETGWSKPFLKLAFKRAGMKLKTYEGIGLDHGVIGYAVRAQDGVEVSGNPVSHVVPKHWITGKRP